MVGVPRSHGCLLCVHRRVRCDEGRPGCAKCVSYGAECPGYDRSLKFVTGKHQVRKKGVRGGLVAAGGGGEGSGDGEGSSAGVSAGTEGGSVLLTVTERPARSPPRDAVALFSSRLEDDLDSSATAASSLVLASSSSSSSSYYLSRRIAIPRHPKECRAAFINTILYEIALDRKPQEQIFYGSWFYRLPDRLGRKVTLDSAVCAFAMHLLGKSKGNETLVIQSRQLYGQSLVALQQALEHPVEWRSSETLSTMMTMCLYELFADTLGHSLGWQQHCRAVIRLIQSRGAQSYLDDMWDRSMLFSFRSLIIMEALFNGKDCFLAKKKWQRVLSNLGDMEMPTLAVFGAAAVPVIERHILYLARLPTVMRHGWAVRIARLHGLPVDPAQIAILNRAASSLHAALSAWYSEAVPFLGNPPFVEVPSNVPPDAPPSPYSTVLAYPNHWNATVYLSYVTCMLIVQESLNQVAAARAEFAYAEAAARATLAASPSMSSTTNSTSAAPTPSSSSQDTESALQAASDGQHSGSSPDSAELSAPSPAMPPRPYDEANREICRIIYRSFETLGGGLMGQYRIGFAMRISYEFADVPTQLWIRALLRRSVKTFASSTADTFPPPRENEYGYN